MSALSLRALHAMALVLAACHHDGQTRKPPPEPGGSAIRYVVHSSIAAADQLHGYAWATSLN